MDVLGLILRAEVIWSKPNGIPESVRDRVRRSHDTWFHFTLNPRYYSAVDLVREQTGHEMSWETYEKQRGKSWHDHTNDAERGMADLPDKPPVGVHPLGRSLGSVWTVPPQALTVPPEIGVDHYATFPMELPRRIIRGWSPSGICTVCGEGRRPNVDVQYDHWVDAGPKTKQARVDEPGRALSYASGMSAKRRTTIVGETCGCETPDAPTVPAVVLDPFGGTGTTALVASVLGRLRHLGGPLRRLQPARRVANQRPGPDRDRDGSGPPQARDGRPARVSTSTGKPDERPASSSSSTDGQLRRGRSATSGTASSSSPASA